MAVARPLTRMYSTWALANLAQAATASSAGQQAAEPAEQAASAVATDLGNQDTALSRSEEIRIMRAVYQCETYHRLFGLRKEHRRGAFHYYEINHVFFCLFDPWEVEAVGCIDMFIRQRYDFLFDEVWLDFLYANSKPRQPTGDINPGRWSRFDPNRQREDYMEATVSRGLKLTARLLAINDHDTLVGKMQQCLVQEYNPDHPIVWTLEAMAQDDRRERIGLNARDEAEARRDPIEFAGDGVPVDGPPLGWVRLWGGRYSNLCGEYVPLAVRQWGYVMWDERRWTALVAGDLIAKQWETSPGLADKIERDYLWHPSGPERSMGV